MKVKVCAFAAMGNMVSTGNNINILLTFPLHCRKWQQQRGALGIWEQLLRDADLEFELQWLHLAQEEPDQVMQRIN